MYDPNNPTPAGGFGITSAGPKPFDSFQQVTGANPRAPQMMGALHGGMGDWRDAYKQAKFDWRGQRPMQGDMSQMDWRTALMGWRDLKPDKGGFKHGQQVPGQQAPAATPVAPAVPQTFAPIPLNPYGNYGG